MHREYSHRLPKHVGVCSTPSIHFVCIQVHVGEGELLCSMKGYVKRTLTSDGSISRICWPMRLMKSSAKAASHEAPSKSHPSKFVLNPHRCIRCPFIGWPCCFGPNRISGKGLMLLCSSMWPLGLGWYWAISSSIFIKWDNKDFTFDQSCASGPETP